MLDVFIHIPLYDLLSTFWVCSFGGALAVTRKALEELVCGWCVVVSHFHLLTFHHGPPPNMGGIAKDKPPLAHGWGVAVGQRGTKKTTRP